MFKYLLSWYMMLNGQIKTPITVKIREEKRGRKRKRVEILVKVVPKHHSNEQLAVIS